MTLYIDFDVKVARDVAQYPLHHVTYARTKFEDGAVKEMHLQENTVIDLCPCGQGHTRWVQFLLHNNHVTYVPAKFEVATLNDLRGDSNNSNKKSCLLYNIYKISCISKKKYYGVF